MNQPKLFMALLGCRPAGRRTEQHDVFFGIGPDLKALVPAMKAFWPGVKLHVDAWREVTSVDGHRISVVPAVEATPSPPLYFVNLGGYRPDEFEEYHYKVLAVGEKCEAVKKAKQTAFYKHCGFAGAVSHIDDTYGIDLDDLLNVTDLFTECYSLSITPDLQRHEDVLHLGYQPLDKL